MPVSSWMVDAVAPQPGDTLLELAAGPGDTGFLAAELVKPGGTLICSDFVPEMLTVAQERAQALGLDNVRFKQIDAETSIDIEAASIDGGPLPLGLHADGRPGDGARPDPPGAQAGRRGSRWPPGPGPTTTPGARSRPAS